MTDSLYSIYQNDTVKLIGSLIIKSTSTAEAVNRGVIYNGGDVDQGTPDSWRYYKHLSGEYHYTDTPMKIISHDTQEIINYSKSNLLIHKSTAINYLKDPQYVNTLIDKYPDQINLINGILKPIDIQVAIDAIDGEILYHDPSLIEDNESTLLIDIQSAIYTILGRWYIEDYGISDELYPAVFYAVLISSLIPLTLNLRLNRCNTIEAHSYHIREYLASRNGLDRYTDALSKKQLLWLYRNVNYIRSNIGKQEILNSLIDNILTPRNIPVGEFHIEQNIEHLLETGLPVGELVSFPINTQSSGIRDRFLTVEQMLIKERKSAKGNEDAEVEFIPKTNSLLARSGHNTLPTKVLESVMVDFGEYSPVVLTDTLYHYWGYLSSVGQYTAIIEANIGGQETILSVLDAFVLYTYALYKAAGITLDEIPTFYANNILKSPRPTIVQLKAIVDSKYISESKLTGLLADIPEVGTHISTLGFLENVSLLHKRFKQHRLQYAKETDGIGRGMLDGAANYLYYTIPIEVASEATYGEWLSNRTLDFTSLTKDDWLEVSIELFKKSTGYVEDKSLADIQESLIGLVEQLTSYTIQWIYEINHGRIIPLDNRTLRISNPYLLPLLKGRIRPVMDYVVSNSKVTMKGEMGEPMPMVAHLSTEISGIVALNNSLGAISNPVINIRAPLPICNYVQVIIEHVPDVNVDDEDIVSYSRIVLDLPFTEANPNNIIDHSPNNSTIIQAYGTDGVNTAGNKLNITDGISNLIYQLYTLEAEGLPRPPRELECTFDFIFNSLDHYNALRPFIFWSSTQSNQLISTIGIFISGTNPSGTPTLPLLMTITAEGISGTTVIYNSSIILTGSFKFHMYDNILTFTNNGNIIFNGPVAFERGAGMHVNLQADNGNTHVTPLSAVYDNYIVKYYYTGRPWYLNSMLCLNFEQEDPDLDPGLVMSGASGSYSNAFIQDLSFSPNTITYGRGTSQDLVISRDSLMRGVGRLRHYTLGSLVPDWIKIIDFEVLTNSISIEFIYSHNRATLGTTGGTFSIVKISGPSINVDVRHDGTNRLQILGVGSDWTNGSGITYIQSPPEGVTKYLLNIGPTSKEFYINGVLALSAPSGVAISTNKTNLLEIFKSSGGIAGLDISMDNIIITCNYPLDPLKNRVIPS